MYKIKKNNRTKTLSSTGFIKIDRGKAHYTEMKNTSKMKRLRWRTTREVNKNMERFEILKSRVRLVLPMVNSGNRLDSNRDVFRLRRF